MTLTFSGLNNRIDGYSYDAAGNVLNDGSHSYTYDAENRIISVDGGATTYGYGSNVPAPERTAAAHGAAEGHVELHILGGYRRARSYEKTTVFIRANLRRKLRGRPSPNHSRRAA
jgi:YD repeat-containing protein